MNCEHCNSEDLGERFIKSAKSQKYKTKKYFRHCKNCGYNTYFDFPEYLDESQFDRYVEQSTKKGDANKRKTFLKTEFYNEDF